jgi:deoxyinosine 3'endonuclease (endonuclease V)
MLMAAFDVHYLADGRASAAAVLFGDYKDSRPVEVTTQCIPDAADYIAGHFRVFSNCSNKFPGP